MLYEKIKAFWWQNLVDANVSITSIARISAIAFYLISTFYASYVFIQFSVLEIVSVSATFLVMFLLLLTVFMPGLFKEKLSIKPVNIFWSVVVLGFLLVIFNSPSTQFFNYFRTFPLLEAELGLGWHQDSAFHSSIIHSFTLFGFSSIGQHDTPITVYHVLSHFMDSVIIRITGVDVWQSYGLFYFFKAVLLLSAILFFITFVCRHLKLYVFLLSLMFLVPIVVATWHAIGSHGLWFTSLIIILSAPLVFRLVTQKEPLRSLDYVVLFALLVAISLGKVSSGFMYAALIGLMLVLVHFKDYRVYLFGLALLAFFAIYNSTITGGEGSIVIPELKQILKFLALKTKIFYDQLYQVYLLIALIVGTAFLFKSNAAARFFIASVLSVFVLALVVSMQPNFSGSDIWYFVYGLSSVLILLTYQLVLSTLNTHTARNFEGVIYFNHPIIKTLLVLVMLGLTSDLNSTSYNFFNSGVKPTKSVLQNAYKQPFSRLNSYDKTLKANMVKQFKNRDYIDLGSYPRPLNAFNESLKSFMSENSLRAKDSLIFMPKEIFETDMDSFKGAKWARGMLVYAVTGVPLVHGLESLRRTYGYADYDESALWVSKDRFDITSACQFEKNIIIVESFAEPNFTVVSCQ